MTRTALVVLLAAIAGLCGCARLEWSPSAAPMPRTPTSSTASPSPTVQQPAPSPAPNRTAATPAARAPRTAPASHTVPSSAPALPEGAVAMIRLHNGWPGDPWGRTKLWANPDHDEAVRWLASEIRRVAAEGYETVLFNLPAGVARNQKFTASQSETIEEERWAALERHIPPVLAQTGVRLGLYTGWWLGDPASRDMGNTVSPDPDNPEHLAIMARNTDRWIRLGVRELWFDNAAADKPKVFRRWREHFAQRGIRAVREAWGPHADGEDAMATDRYIGQRNLHDIKPLPGQDLYVALIDTKHATPERIRQWHANGFRFVVYTRSNEPRFTEMLRRLEQRSPGPIRPSETDSPALSNVR